MAGQPPQYMPPPPPPPGYGGEGFLKKPTSGKAIASLICGICSVVLVICYVPVVAAVVGVVLGILAIVETGKEGRRSGRGLAIAGTIVSVLGIAALIAWHTGLTMIGRAAEEQMNQAIAKGLDKDQGLLLERLKNYYDENEKSLGPGGPVQTRRLAKVPATNAAPADNRPRVTGALGVEHLAEDNDLSYGSSRGSGMGWKLTVTGKASAILSATDWSGAIVREITIQDIGRNQYVQTVDFDQI